MNRQILFLTMSALLLGACGEDPMTVMDSADMSVATPHNFAQISAEVFQYGCTFSACHEPNNKNLTKLDLCAGPHTFPIQMEPCPPNSNADKVYNRLVGQPAENAKAKAMGLQLVKPCDPENSFLMMKLKLPSTVTDASVDYGSHMPTGLDSLDPAVIKAIGDWIARGAHRNEPEDVSGTTCVMSEQDLSTID